MMDPDSPGTRIARARAQQYRMPWYREETLGRPNWQWAVLAAVAIAINGIAYIII